MGLSDAIFNLAPQDAAKELFKGATGPAAAADPAKLFAGEPIHIAHAFNGQQFKTPSGKLEFYSEQLAKQGVSPVPDWNEDPVEVAEAAKWPLRLLTAPGYFQAHTAFSGVGFLRQREGKPFCVLHPEDAAKRGLKQGDEVRLFNGRGEIGLVLQVNDDIQPGVVLVPGQRPTSEAVSGTINMLCSDRYTDMGEGATLPEHLARRRAVDRTLVSSLGGADALSRAREFRSDHQEPLAARPTRVARPQENYTNRCCVRSRLASFGTACPTISVLK